eukprot:5367356-Pleurochrysis_carterae.AAC.1
MNGLFVCILLGTVLNASKDLPQKRRSALLESSGSSFFAKLEDLSMRDEPGGISMLTLEKAQELAQEA